MKLAYVDTSCLVEAILAEAGAESLKLYLTSFERLFASNLLEAELRSALAREGLRKSDFPILTDITWVYPNRPLSAELQRVLAAGYLKGADLWHLACALFLAPDVGDLAFLTLDKKQNTVAAKLGFSTSLPIF